MIRQWAYANELIVRLKWISLISISVSLILAIALISQLYSDPIVLLKECDFMTPLRVENLPLEVSKRDLTRFSEKFIQLRYTSSPYTIKNILKNIQPFVTKSLFQEISSELSREESGFPKGKQVSLSVANVQAFLENGKITAQFDKITKFENLPLISSHQVRLEIIKTSSSYSNPLGLYVDNLIKEGP